MRRRLPWLGVLALLVVFLPALGADGNSDTSNKTDTKEKKDARDKVLKPGKRLTAKLVRVEEAQRFLTVEIKYQTTKQDPNVVQNIINLKRQQMDAVRNRNPVERAKQLANIQIEMEKNQRNLLKEETQKIELEAAEDMKVRTLLEPVELDDKGKPRKLTEKEKKELKGPETSLPGYTADFDSLKPDQMVDVYLVKTKDAPKAKTKDKDLDTDKPRPKVAMIVIRAEGKK